VTDNSHPHPHETRVSSHHVVACILTLNEEMNLPEAIRSVKELSDTIVVVDSGSNDRTVEIASTEGAHVWRREFDTEHRQRNWAADRIEEAWPRAWLLELDADERLTTELATEIGNLLTAGPEHDAYLIPFRFFLDRRLLRFGGFTDTQLPRFRRVTAGRYEDRRINPQLILVPGKLGRLRGHIIHADVGSWERHIEKHNRYSTLEAEARLYAQSHPETRIRTMAAIRSPHLRRRWLRERIWNHLPLKPLLMFLNSYVIHSGWLDGRAGLTNAVFRSWHTMCIDLKYKEMRSEPAPRRT
jgi:glycosyltransferase involved in cell wall biosynthesis